MFGFLNVNKPSGITSRAVVNAVQKIVRPLKVGHSGTLDPLASGVLVIGIGQATRLTQYVQGQSKSYTGRFLLGVESDTEDIEGDCTEVQNSNVVGKRELAAAIPEFIGEIQQMPPAYSALKVDGKRAYELARAGKSVELKARNITIHELSLSDFGTANDPKGIERTEFELQIRCGSGTYVRSLGRDLARACGSGATMSSLIRTAVGNFKIEDAMAPDGIVDTVAIQDNLQSPNMAFVEHRAVTIDQSTIERLSKGFLFEYSSDEGELLAVDCNGNLVAILRPKKPGIYRPAVNFAHYWLANQASK